MSFSFLDEDPMDDVEGVAVATAADGSMNLSAANEAYAKLMAQLGKTTSPHVGKITRARDSLLIVSGGRRSQYGGGLDDSNDFGDDFVGGGGAAEEHHNFYVDVDDNDGIHDGIEDDEEEEEFNDVEDDIERVDNTEDTVTAIKSITTMAAALKQPGAGLITPKRSVAAVFARANTPVMSNESKRKQDSPAAVGAASVASTVPKSGARSVMMTADRSIPANVQSPWITEDSRRQAAADDDEDDTEGFLDNADSPLRSVVHNPVVARSNPSSKSSHADFRRYYDVFQTYVVKKRRLAERIDASRQVASTAAAAAAAAGSSSSAMVVAEEQSPAAATGSSSPGCDVDPSLVAEETRIELDFLKALHTICWDLSSRSNGGGTSTVNMNNNNNWNTHRKEGNFWLLLACLRKLGLPSLAYDDAVLDQAELELQEYIQSLSNRAQSTPLELIQATRGGGGEEEEGCPLVLRRRRCILLWLETCFSKDVPPGATRPLSTTTTKNSRLLTEQGLPETDRDAELLRSSLSLILAGRTEDAKKLVRESHVPWRAASWDGEEAHGYQVKMNDDTRQVEHISIGNPRRALWRRTMWRLSEHLNNAPTSGGENGAICAILSNHVMNALDHPCLRTWEKGLYVLLRSIVGRMEDELLHLHNNNRRELQPRFPGTEYEEKEKEHLAATTDLASKDEFGALQILRASPFGAMHVNDPYSCATESFLVGKNEATAFMETIFEQFDTSMDEVLLRFLTHLVLYLDSLSACTTPVSIGVVSHEHKDEVILLYLQYLASREDFWYQLVLYGSQLSEENLFRYLPKLLTVIESMKERKVIVKQLADCLALPGQDLEILRAVVHMIVHELDEEEPDPETPTRLDLRKMNSILWFSFDEEHMGEGLILANKLLRQFLHFDKMSSALLFIDDKLPPEIFDKVAENASISTFTHGDPSGDDCSIWNQACSEHVAFCSYLEAVRAVTRWRDVITSTNTKPLLVDDRIDTSRLNKMEAQIAEIAERQELVREKRKLSSVVVKATDLARKTLLRVLEHPGGWLLAADDSDDDAERRSELLSLRQCLLPKVVINYYTVCMDTSTWMTASLDDAVERLGGDPSSILATLDEAVESTDESPVSPKYWIRHVQGLAQSVESDEYDVKSTFLPDDLDTLLMKLADADAVLEATE